MSSPFDRLRSASEDDTTPARLSKAPQRRPLRRPRIDDWLAMGMALAIGGQRVNGDALLQEGVELALLLQCPAVEAHQREALKRTTPSEA